MSRAAWPCHVLPGPVRRLILLIVQLPQLVVTALGLGQRSPSPRTSPGSTRPCSWSCCRYLPPSRRLRSQLHPNGWMACALAFVPFPSGQESTAMASGPDYAHVTSPWSCDGQLWKVSIPTAQIMPRSCKHHSCSHMITNMLTWSQACMSSKNIRTWDIKWP